MREEFEKLAAAGKIGRQHIEPLLKLAQGGYCTHRNWGFGRITTVDTVFCRFTIDFQSKPGHTMDLGFAADSLKPIAPEHILVRKASDLAGLRQMAALNHLDLIKLVLESFGGKATVDQIQQVLVPDVITEDWKKWWEAAKRELKKDGHFQVPLKKNEPIVYQTEEVSLQDRLLQEFRAARGLKAKVGVTVEVLKNLEDLNDRSSAATEIIAGLNGDIGTHQRTQPAVALEGIFARDELKTAAGIPGVAEEVNEAAVWANVVERAEVLEGLPAAKYKRGLQSFKEAHPEDWDQQLISILNSVSARLCGEAANLLIHEGRFDAVKDHVARLINQHAASSELLLWLAKERSDAFADILGPEVFRAMLTAMERDQFNEKKSNKLHDYIMSDDKLLVELIDRADLDVIRDLTRALQFSPSFEDMDKRSLLARIVKSHPAVQSLISGDQSKQEAGLIVSWESLERRKNEYADLVEKKIPANSKEIAIARSYGDLRENHEYKAAKEMQKLLMRRKAELEVQLVRARGTDFANARSDVVSVGTRVGLTDLNTHHSEQYLILGAWDSDPEKGVVSYLSPLAQALLNHAVAEEIEFEMDAVKKRYRIDSIQAYRQPEPAAMSAGPPSPLPAAAVEPPPEVVEPPVADTAPPEDDAPSAGPETRPA